MAKAETAKRKASKGANGYVMGSQHEGELARYILRSRNAACSYKYEG